MSTDERTERVYTVDRVAHFEDYTDGSLFLDEYDGTVYRLAGWTTIGGYWEQAEIDQPILERVDGVEMDHETGWNFPLRFIWAPEQENEEGGLPLGESLGSPWEWEQTAAGQDRL